VTRTTRSSSKQRFAARAEFLVTKDRELLALGKKRARVPFLIITPAQFRAP